MEIIVKGFLPETVKYDLKCNYCKTEIRIEKQEGTISNHRNETILSYPCPLCNKEIFKDI